MIKKKTYYKMKFYLSTLILTAISGSGIATPVEKRQSSTGNGPYAPAVSRLETYVFSAKASP